MSPLLPSVRKKSAPYVWAVLGVLFVMVISGLFTGEWPVGRSMYPSYSLQAQAWLEGRLDLGRDYIELELAIFDGKYYVSFPPFPSYVLLPFVAVFRDRVPENAIAWAVTLLGALYAVRLYQMTRRDGRSGFWVLFLYLGTGYLFISVNAWVWFIAQTMCFTLSLMALVHAKKGQGGIALACWACAVGCRPMAALYLPLLVWLLWQARGSVTFWQWVRRRWYWAVPTLLIAGSYMALNYARFGNPIEFGHNYLPEFVLAEHGQFSLSYIPEHIELLLRLPAWDAYWNRAAFYTLETQAFWLINPMVFCFAAAWAYGLVKRRSAPTLWMLPVMAAAHVFIICCHKTLGAWQFGNRYLLDLLPWLFYGLLVWMPEDDRFIRWSEPLFVWGFAINVVGTIATYNQWI